MKCKEIYETMPDLAAGLSTLTPEIDQHLRSCEPCSAKLQEFRQTMALLDEWKAPEPSTYFDTRLYARLREEKSKQSVGWMQWVRRPLLAVSLTIMMVGGISLYRNGGAPDNAPVATVPGTAVGDLQALDKNDDLYSDFDVLDDLQVQPDVTANP
jgi:predicted anti-sigma-YlaC factor YlaD